MPKFTLQSFTLASLKLACVLHIAVCATAQERRRRAHEYQGYLAGGFIHFFSGRTVWFAHHCFCSYIVYIIERLHMQGPSSLFALSAFIATTDLVSCIMYEVIQEALHEVCMRLPLTCCSPNVTWAMILFLSRVAACCSHQLHITTFALLHFVDVFFFLPTLRYLHFIDVLFFLVLLRSCALRLGAFLFSFLHWCGYLFF
jgi:hypothetical protein